LWCPETPEIKQEGMPAMLNATERSDTTKGWEMTMSSTIFSQQIVSQISHGHFLQNAVNGITRPRNKVSGDLVDTFSNITANISFLKTGVLPWYSFNSNTSSTGWVWWLTPVIPATVCNPSYLEGGEQEDCYLKPAQAKTLPTISKNKLT
jgi:hypothetical protein